MRLQVNFKHLRLYFYLVNPTQTLYTKHLGPVIFIHVMDWGMCSCTSHFSPEMADKWLVLWTVGNNWLDLEIEQLHTWPVTVWIDIKLMLNKFINMSYLACFWVTKGMVNRKFMKKIQPTIKITNLVQKSSCNTICTLAEKLHLQYKMLLIKKTLQLKTQ